MRWSRSSRPRSTVWASSGRAGPPSGGLPDWRRGRARASRGAAPAPGRGLRLGGRRAHRPARAARAAAPRGLRLPRGRRALPVRRPHAGGARGVRARGRRGADRAPDQAARGRLQLGDRRGAARAAHAADGDDARRRRARRGPARRGAGGGGDPQRARRAAGHAGHGGQRRLRARDPRRGPVRRRHRGRVPGPDGDHRGRLPVRPPRRRHGARLLRAAAGSTGRHRDPRLHPLPARPPDPPAHARPRRRDRHLGRAAGPPGRARPRRARARQPGGRRGRLPLPLDRRRRRRSPPSARASCRCRSGPSSTSTCGSGRRHERPRAQRRPRPRTSSGRSSIEAELRAPRHRLGADLLRRDARDLHRVGRRSPCRAGWPARAAAG